MKAHIVDLKLSVKLIDRKLKYYDEWIASGKQPGAWWPGPKKRDTPDR